MKITLVGLFLVLTACGSADDSKDLFGSRVCVPGATQECACPGGAKGAQACNDDGSGFAACDCAGGSGGGAGADGGGQSGSGGTGGAGGGCTPRTTCPDAPDGGAQLCGMIDNYCGGTISCGCEFGECSAGACECGRAAQYDSACAKLYMRPIAMSCTAAAPLPTECKWAQGPINGVDGPGFPVHTLCCAH